MKTLHTQSTHVSQSRALPPPLDSTVLAHILTLLNARHSYGLDLFLLSIDEGITGYRDDSLETVKRNEKQVASNTWKTTSIDPFVSDGYLLKNK